MSWLGAIKNYANTNTALVRNKAKCDFFDKSKNKQRINR